MLCRNELSDIVLQELLQWCSLEAVGGQQRPSPIGSAAVMQAPQATIRAQTAERQLTAAIAERDSLARQVQELKPPELPDQDTSTGKCTSLRCRHVSCCMYMNSTSGKFNPASMGAVFGGMLVQTEAGHSAVLLDRQ